MQPSALDAARAAAARYSASLRDPVRAEDAARAALRNCRMAAEILCGRLKSEGFPVVGGVLPRADARLLARATELLGQRPPRLLELFWEEVGGIELADFHHYQHATFFDDRNIVPSTLARTTDAVVLDGLSDPWLDYLDVQLESYREELEEYAEDLDDEEIELDETDAPEFLISLAPDHYHKDNISGGGPYGIALGDGDWLPVFGGSFTWIGTTKPVVAAESPDLLSYLRASILECGGFPGMYGCPEYEPLRQKLTADLPVF